MINMKEIKDIIQEYIDRSPLTVNENANNNFAISGLKSHISSTILKDATIQESPASEYHRKGCVHLHDSAGGKWSAYCRGLDLLQIMMEGIKNPAGTSSKSAKHYDVVVDHIVNAFYVSQSEWEGAQAFSNVDTLLAGFVWNDDLTQREVTQGMQRLVFNLSYPLRAGMQTPFTNLSFDLTCPDHMSREPVIIGGMPTEKMYGELQKEMDMVNLGFLNVMLAGDKDGNPHTFPIPTFAITKDFNWDCPVTDKLFELTAKFGLPYFMSYVGSGLDPSSVRSMCCRLSMDLNDVVEASKGGLWNAGVNTGSLSVVTINLAQLGYLSRKRTETNEEMVDYFYNRLNTLLDAARDHNVWKREKINEGFEMGLMPFTKSYLPNFDSFFSTIGVVGGNEMTLNMWGLPIYECNYFVDGVLEYIHKYVRKLTKEYGYPWNLEETPAEGCSHSLALKDKAKYPDIITQGDRESVFYTNSTHIFVGDNVGLADSLHIQEQFKRHYSGGTLFHLFCGEGSPNPGGIKDLIKNICTKTKIPYIAFTKAYSVCPKCGINSDLSGTCPTCGSETNVYDRVTGFYRPVKSWGAGKQAEFSLRNRFDKDIQNLDLNW